MDRPNHLDLLSDTCRARVRRDGLLQVYSRKPAVVDVHRYDPAKGDWSHDEATPDDGTPAGELAAALTAAPIFAATADGEDPGLWYVDAEAGFQRWLGSVTDDEMLGALTKLGFGDYAGAIMAYCQAHPWTDCPLQVP